MNLAAFAVIIARERETRPRRRHLVAVRARRATGRWLAWPMTIAMLALAGFPATAGFFGKIYLIDAAVDNGYGWLGVVIVLGSAISLAYYLRVVAAVWMRSPSRGRPRRWSVPPLARRSRAGRRRPTTRPAPPAASRAPTSADRRVRDFDTSGRGPAHAAPARGRLRRRRLRAR